MRSLIRFAVSFACATLVVYAAEKIVDRHMEKD
jgi:hypothetical protein